MPPASIAISQSGVLPVPIEAIFPSSMTIVSPAATGDAISPERIFAMLKIAVFTADRSFADEFDTRYCRKACQTACTHSKMIMSDIRRVLVVGGGVGGLTAATAFARRGVEVVLIERRPAFDIPGVGLGQPANALRVYDTLGVLEQVLTTGFAYDRMHIFDPQRRLIAEHKFLLGDDRVPAFCALSRLQLHQILLGAAERAGVQVRLGTIGSQFHAEGERVG